MKKLLFVLLLIAAPAWAQSGVKQSGHVTPGHVSMWTTNGVIQDGGTAARGFLTSLGVTASGPGICQNTGPITGPYNQICLSPNSGLSFQNQNGASALPFTFSINGATFNFPFTGPGTGIIGANPSINGGPMCWASATGTAAQDCATTSGPVSFPNGILVEGTDLNVRQSPNDHVGVAFDCTVTSAGNALGFIDENCLEVFLTPNHGYNWYGDLTFAKSTFIAANTGETAVAAGQHNMMAEFLTCYGIGDCFGFNQIITYVSADIEGDEGIGFNSNTIAQQSVPNQTTITSVTATTCNTTATQAITGNFIVQAVSVASTSGCNVGDWVIVDQEIASGRGAPNNSAVQLTAVGAGTISGVFETNQNSGVTITPAKVIGLSNVTGLGEQRVMVNLSTASTYSTGTVSTITGGQFNGSGTAWSTGMVGGNATNVGCIYLDADTLTSNGGPPSLHMWYQIETPITATSLGIFTFSIAGDQSYHGKGPGAGTYLIRPCLEVLRIVGNTAIAESTSTTWQVGDLVEFIIPPYADVSGYHIRMAHYTTGGAGARAIFNIYNLGQRTIGSVLNTVGTNTPSGTGGADNIGYQDVIQLNAGMGTALHVVGEAIDGPIVLARLGGVQCPISGDICTRITWATGHPYIGFNSTKFGMEIDTGAGLLNATPNINGAQVGGWQFAGMWGTVPDIAQNLGTCSGTQEGLEKSVTNSTTNTYGATVSAGGSFHIKARCNGTNWVVN